VPGRWAFILAATTGEPLAELTEARSRRLSAHLDAPSTVGFSIDGRHPHTFDIDELATDLLVYRDTDLLYRGRVGQTQDQAGADNHTVTVETADYRALLGRRILWEPFTFTAEEQEAVGWALIDHTQTQPGGDLGVTRRPDQTTGVSRDRTYPEGKNIGEALTQLGQVSDGFEWDISPELEYRVWSQRGADNGVVLDYGGLITGFSRTVNPSAFANAVRVTGKEDEEDNPGPTPERHEVADFDPHGRFDAQHGYPDITQQATLAARAAWHLSEGSTLRPSWNVTLRAGVWDGPDHIWLGDTVLLAVRSGRVDTVQPLRVQEVDVDVDEDGGETVRLTLGRAQVDLASVLRRTTQRLTDLERR
jgi:hypothetical protein